MTGNVFRVTLKARHTMSYKYVLSGVICLVIWFFNGKWLIHAIRERITSEIYMHVGLGIFLTLLTLELILGDAVAGRQLDILWLQILGFILYIPAFVLVAASFFALNQKGQASDLTETLVFIDTGIYGIVRQPMALGCAIWSTALILVFRSVFSLILGLLCGFLFWMAARTEDAYDIRKFGDQYREYMKRVPMWNVFKGLARRRT